MKRTPIVGAFVLGCMSAVALQYATNGIAQVKPGPNPQEARLKALEQRAAILEQGSPQPSKKVMAPFVVTNLSGAKIFDVTPDGANVYGPGARLMASMTGQNGGGLLEANAASGPVTVWLDSSLGSPTFTVNDNGSAHVELGRGAELGTYRLKFTSGSSQSIAGIGEDKTSGTGLALVYDKAGNLKSRMAVSGDGKGLIDVLGANKLPIAQLTQGSHKGGLLLLCTPSGCDPPMVEAGDAGGYGIVRAGPQGFNPGVTMLGLPGSVITGRHQ